MSDDFFSLYNHGFVRVAVGVPEVRVADPRYNAEKTLDLARHASAAGAALVLFPELGLSAYTNEDLFHQDALLSQTLCGLEEVVTQSLHIGSVLIVGLPLKIDGMLFNAAVAVHRGRILGATAKTYIPNYREFYEKRQFVSVADAVRREIRLVGQTVPFGPDVILSSLNIENFVVHMEICEDVWAPIPPSTYAALGGATVLCNLSASNITIGKAAYRKDLSAHQSAKCIAAYLYSVAGMGESTTDLGWDGHALIYENNELLAEAERFANRAQLIYADIDLDVLVQERMRNTTFNDARSLQGRTELRRVDYLLEPENRSPGLEREIARFPYVPAAKADRDARCYEAYNIQVHSLAKRLHSAAIKRLVIGVSGGLDSTHALIVAAKTMDQLELPRTNILAYTMPGFATSAGTKENAVALMATLGVSSAEIDIRPSCMQMFRDIDHPFARGEEVYDTTFENVQAGERTSHLFRLANQNGAMVLGTGDLSELALGWATYGVGDHMSHYNVNASVPKTLIQYLIRWNVNNKQFDRPVLDILDRVLKTEISPELVPGAKGAGGDGPSQRTEEKIGPYELQDFHLYWISRFGLNPKKVAYLAYNAWSDVACGHWPEDIPQDRRNQYDLVTIVRWLEVFLRRFFAMSQFKRSCVPNGPKVGSGGSLSPRGDWRAPSDSVATPWLDELAHIPKDAFE